MIAVAIYIIIDNSTDQKTKLKALRVETDAKQVKDSKNWGTDKLIGVLEQPTEISYVAS